MSIPIRLRLTLVFALAMAIVLSGFGAFVYIRLHREMFASVDAGLLARAEAIASELEAGLPSPVGPPKLTEPEAAFAQLLDPEGRVLLASPATLRAPLVQPTALRSVARPTFVVATVPGFDADPLRLLVAPEGSPPHQRFVIAGVSLGDQREALQQLLISLTVGGPVALFTAAAAAWLVAGGALRPVERLSREAAAISASELNRRLPIPSTGDELARLAKTLNEMLERLQGAMEHERRLVDNASHELRTPLSVLKMELDLALARSRTPEELEAALAAAAAETDRLVRLSQDLLVLARMDRGRLPVHRTRVTMEEIVRPSVARSSEHARTAGVAIRTRLDCDTVEVDPARVRQALENLLDNALRHSGPGGEVTIRSQRVGDAVRLSVDDSGPGFPPDLLDSAFEPFVSRETDGHGNGPGSGAGLGLAIVRAVAEAHGGEASAENRPHGARVTLTLRA